MQSNQNADQLRAYLATGKLFVTPCCGEALTARLIELAEFELAFVSGFGVSASRLGMPDTGLISFGEMFDQVQNIVHATSIPLLVDGDTGYGNALNVKRTVQAYAGIGVACVMIEDQVAPKRCGHTQGKQVVDRKTAYRRIQAAVDAREQGRDILIMGRTDSLESLGIEEAIDRAKQFHKIGADITFIESPRTEDALKRICDEVPGRKMANMLEGGLTPILKPDELEKIGFSIASYPFTLLMKSIQVIQDALGKMRQGEIPTTGMDFQQLKTIVGFDEYYEAESKYS